MPFDAATYERSCEHYRNHWQAADEVLYAVARPHAGPCTDAEINAKLLVIGRSYATGIERQVSNPRPSAIARLSEFFAGNRDAIDGLVAEAADLQEPLTLETLRAIVGIHGRFVHLLRGVTRPDETPWSFASKYLHFHAPAVPIYDSYAAERALPHIYRWQPGFAVFEPPEGADHEYARFVFRFWQLYQDAVAAGQHVSVKLLDYYLWYAIGLNGGQA